ncbi:MAG TPA: hypothetical protein VM284_07505 [Candidatus Limnocylindria bacterium]|nr:hypothetical protein [Candidatus Limnocylindria bacterium]
MKLDALVAVLGLALVTGCTTPTPTPSPTSAPTPTAAPSQALGPQVDAVVATVPALRELDATRNVPYELITREQFQEDLVELNDAEVPIEVRHAEERLYKRLGLLPPDSNLDELVQQLYGEQVLAYYQPDNGHFYLIGGDRPFGATDKIVVAHEYTHALQDQHFDLKNNTITDNTRGDARLAQLAVIEGDATLTSQLWATDNLDFGDMLQLLLEGLGQLDTASLDGFPLVLRRYLEFPYTEGFVFATALHDEGGFDAVNDALTTPPASTEQILHPEKYLGHEVPVDVPAPDLLDELGPDWQVAYEQTLGELGIQVLAAGGEVPEGAVPGLAVEWPHQEVAAGWGGDRLRMYENADHWRVEWTTVWDTEADAISFRARMDQLSTTFDGLTAISIDGDRVDLSIADE